MALSNWDTIAFNNDGESCNGVFKNSMGSSLEIYKNWIYIRNEKMWRSGGSFVKPTIAQINHGDIQVAGFDITAARGNQNGIFVFASTFEKVTKDKYKYSYFGGIGCSGYKDKVEEVLKNLGRASEISDDWISGSSHGPNVEIHFIEKFDTGEKIVYWDCKKQGPYDYNQDWVGVLSKTVDEYFSWLESMDICYEGFDEWFSKIKKSQKLRFNQGDAYIASTLGMPVPVTKPGEVEHPILHDLIQESGVDNREP